MEQPSKGQSKSITVAEKRKHRHAGEDTSLLRKRTNKTSTTASPRVHPPFKKIEIGAANSEIDEGGGKKRKRTLSSHMQPQRIPVSRGRDGRGEEAEKEELPQKKWKGKERIREDEVVDLGEQPKKSKKQIPGEALNPIAAQSPKPIDPPHADIANPTSVTVSDSSNTCSTNTTSECQDSCVISPPSSPPDDERNCWGSLPRMPINMGLSTKWLPFIRKSGIGVYSSFDKVMAGVSSITSRSRTSCPPSELQREQRRAVGKDRRIKTQTVKKQPVLSHWSPWNDQIRVDGVTIGGVFIVQRFLGGGTYGRVYEVELNTPGNSLYHKKKFAIKFYSLCSTDVAYIPSSTGDMGETGERSFHREAEILSAIHDRNFSVNRALCPSVVQVFGAFAYMVDPLNHQESFYPALVMELATEGSVSSVIKRIAKDPNASPVRLMRFLGSMSAKMAQALIDLHSTDYYQQDVKPSNFLCFRDIETGDWHIKLGDMGLACSMGEMIPRFHCQPIGTPMYIAPELNDMKEHRQLWLNDRAKVCASETYSLACSIRDMFWTSRRVLNLEAHSSDSLPLPNAVTNSSGGGAAAAAAAGCCCCYYGLGTHVDKFLFRERFVRANINMFSAAFGQYFKPLLVRTARNTQSADIDASVRGAFSRMTEFDRLITMTIIAKDWRKRPKLVDLLGAAFSLSKFI